MALSDCHGPDPGQPLARRLDRRVVLKAAAALSALAALRNRAAIRPAAAQEQAETLAATWYEADALAAYDVPGVEAKVIQADFPFYALAPHWDGAATDSPLVEISVSADGLNWGEAFVVGASSHDAGRPDRDGRAFGELVLTGQSSFIRYRTLDAEGNPAQIPDLAFTYIDASPGPTIDDVYSAALTPTLEQPPIISRNAWGANEAYRFVDGMEDWPPDYAPIEHVIIHHTEGRNFEDPLVAIRSIYYYHAVTRGWGDIGYNYLVDFMGNVYEGRYGGEAVIGGHSYQYAIGSAGIGLMGEFNLESATPEMTAGLVWITAWLTRNLDPYGVSDFHETPDLPTICGHRDVGATTCPGDQVYADLQEIRNYVSAVLYEGLAPGPAAGSFVPGDAAEVVVPDANLRAAPGLDEWIVATMPLGSVVAVADGPTTTDGYVWYQIAGAQGIGWCASIVLAPTDALPPPPPGPFTIGDAAIVATDALKLRDQAALAGGVLAVMPTGTSVTVVGGPALADAYLWYQVAGDYGTGWSVAEFLVAPGTPLPPPPASTFAVGDRVRVATDALNLRGSPGMSGGLLAVLPTGTTGSVLGGPEWTDGMAWYQVETVAGTGWSVAHYLEIVPATPDDGPRFAPMTIVRVIDGTLNLRAEPSLTAAVLAVLPDGAELVIEYGPSEHDGIEWWYVQSAAGGGWCAGHFLEPV